METKKTILVVFPHNPFEPLSGVQKRYSELFMYLHQQEFEIDLLALRHFMSSWDEGDLRICRKLVRTLYFYNFLKGFLISLLYHAPARRYLINRFLRRGALTQLPDFAFQGMKQLFRQLVTTHHYDYVLISYVHWAGLLEQELPYRPVTVLTMEDFIARNLSQASLGRADMEAMALEETRRVDLFDKVICLSWEEQQYFSSRTSRPSYFYIPIFMNSREPSGEPETDLLFIGSDNVSNIRAMNWFFREVWPLLPEGITLRVTGRITRHIPDLPGVFVTPFAEDLDSVYGSCRITINPMQDGTGMKVKLIEALSYGLPTVSTAEGLSGISPVLKKELLQANDPMSFSLAIRKLLSDPDWYREQQRLSRSVFRENFDLSGMRKKLNEVFN